jgi:ATP-dependent exoDNAse (exonuclease V) beta subunit
MTQENVINRELEPSADRPEQVIKPVNVISASAGTGKTFRLSSEYVDGLKKVTGNAGIIATTFTNKAADELIERVRRFLLKKGEWQAAQNVLSGYLGTINSICGRLVCDHAIEAGLSPDFTIISEERLAAVFAIAVDTVIYQFADDMHDAARRLQMENWRHDVQMIIDHARNNNLGAETFESFAQSSWERMRALLTEPDENATAEILDANLASAVTTVLEELKLHDDGTKDTKSAIDYLQEVDRRLKSNRLLIWQVWARLANLKVGKDNKRAIQPLVEAAKAHSRHPRLHEDLKTIIFKVFQCAASALQHYSTFKRDHGLIDFADQEHLALRMLQRRPEVRDSFKQKSQILLVDEFQDTSPIQLAVFLEMARLVDYSVWVGDEKQSIFGFRGSDPELMRQAISQIVPLSGGHKQRLVKSYRSRPTLVAFTNALFSKCADTMRITSDSALIEEVDREELEQQNHPLHLWWLNGNHQQIEAALAKSISEVVASPDEWMVFDKAAQELRPIRGSDIAILCRSNRRRMAVARALSAQGLTVATERDSLLDTAECVMSVAALRLLIDDSDTLALAEIANLISTKEDGEWLDAWLQETKTGVESTIPYLEQLKSARKLLHDRTPTEALELAITYGGVMETVMQWGNVRQRLANLDALRGIARTYEEVCFSARTPATAAGLILYIHKNVPEGGDQPANPDENGIHVLTYHKSKGLEWPFVVLYDLDAVPNRGWPFGITVESMKETIDPLKPLEDRAIRYWPWPYGLQRQRVPLQDKADKTREAGIARSQGIAENLRLLYVGMTRARDYLILAGRPTMYGTVWLDALVDDNHQRILTLPCNEQSAEEEIIDGVQESRARIEIKAIAEIQSEASAATDETFVPLQEPPKAVPVFPSFYLNPSGAQENDFKVKFGAQHQLVSIGSRLPMTGSADMAIVGDCVHAFFAVDDFMASESARQQMAENVLKRWQVENLTASQLVEAHDRLRTFVESTFGQVRWHTEMPVSGRLGLRRVAGTIDLLLESDDRLMIVDHKSFPGRFEEWENRALSHSPQLALYKHMVEQATLRKVTDTYIHMPVLGAVVRIDCEIDH